MLSTAWNDWMGLWAFRILFQIRDFSFKCYWLGLLQLLGLLDFLSIGFLMVLLHESALFVQFNFWAQIDVLQALDLIWYLLLGILEDF